MDTLDALRVDRREAKKKTEEIKKRSAILTLRKSGDIARFRFLWGLPEALRIQRHEFYDVSDPSASVRACCAASFGKKCFYCKLAKLQKNRKLAPIPTLVLPIHLYSITNPDTDDTGSDNDCLKLAMFKVHSQAVGHLIDHHDEICAITKCDFRYSRSGSGLDTEYTLLGKSESAWPVGVEVPPKEQVEQLLREALPYMAEPAPASPAIDDERPF